MGKYSPECSVVYLDQKDWICLARQYYRRAPKSMLSDSVIEASNKNKAIFPLSLVHFNETLHRFDNRSRIQLASFMIKVSKGYTIFPGTSRFMEMECQQAVNRILGLPLADLPKFVIGKGISHMVGAKGELVPKPGAKPLPEEVKKRLLEFIESPGAMLKLLKMPGLAKEVTSLRHAHFETVRKMEQIRKKNLRIIDKNLRYRACLVDFFTSTTGPWLADMTLKLRLPKDATFNETWTRKDFQNFFENMPSLFCIFELTQRRDQLIQRPIDVNDINDIMALSMAIPYCDIVVTESMWKSIACQSGLDKKYGTVMLSSVQELAHFI